MCIICGRGGCGSGWLRRGDTNSYFGEPTASSHAPIASSHSNRVETSAPMKLLSARVSRRRLNSTVAGIVLYHMFHACSGAGACASVCVFLLRLCLRREQTLHPSQLTWILVSLFLFYFSFTLSHCFFFSRHALLAVHTSSPLP